MSEETTPTPTNPSPDVASNSGGEDKDSQFSAASAASQILRDKEGDVRPKGRRRRKVSYLTLQKIEHVDYKDIAILKRFLNERGKMLPTRQTGNTAKQQRMISIGIRRAREMALLPFVVIDPPADRPFKPRAPRGDRHSDNN